MTRRYLQLLLVLCFLSWVGFTTNLTAQTATKPPAEVKKRKADPPVESWMHNYILNKPIIAEDTERRIVGLREAGNPHLVEGSALKDATPPRLLTEEELSELRERQIKAITHGREVNWEAPSVHTPEVQVKKAVAPPVLKQVESNRWQIIAFAVGVAAFLTVLRKTRK